jgi:hypothetical protein
MKNVVDAVSTPSPPPKKTTFRVVFFGGKMKVLKNNFYTMDINLVSVLVCAVAAMVIGMIWHNPKVFGNTYMKALGGDTNITPEKMKEIQKKMWQLYLTQFFLVFLEAWILANYAVAIPTVSATTTALWLWAGFVMPTIAGNWMWNPRPRTWAWKGFLISAGYNLVLFMAFSIILGAWM